MIKYEDSTHCTLELKPGRVSRRVRLLRRQEAGRDHGEAGGLPGASVQPRGGGRQGVHQERPHGSPVSPFIYFERLYGALIIRWLSRTQFSSDMTELLKTKAESEDGTLEKCDNETLVVIDKMKGPLWMLVNVTIFGDASTMVDMITAME